MAASQEAPSFDSIIKAGRQKKRNEELANQILGKNRRASAPGSGVGKRVQNATPGSLASRIGVTKRTPSANFRTKKTHQAPSVPTRPAHNRRNDDRLAAALNKTTGQAKVRDNSIGLSIKGASGPFTVVGSNFAPGTTAADIQSAVEPIAGQTLSCLVTSQRPAVTAEIVFAEKWSAETTIANFHNQRADGRVLSMRLKPAVDHDAFNPPSAPRAWSESQPHQSSFNDVREQADQQRRQHRRADPAVEDGSYGFGEQNRPLDRQDRSSNYRYNSRRSNGRQNAYGGGQSRGGRPEAQSSLYSDEMMVDAPSHSRSRR